MPISVKVISQTLQRYLTDDAVLQVTDESSFHKGHAGYNPEIGVTHVAVTLVWEAFKGISMVERQRMVNGWLADLFKTGLHAVRYSLKTLDEANQP